MSNQLEVIEHDGKMIALIVRSEYAQPGIHFLTPAEYSQQLACMYYPPGKEIPAHVHNPAQRDVTYTLEVLFIRRGKLRVDLYDDTQVYLESRILAAGDVIFLASGGHGFEVLEELDMIEVKQGPYSGDNDKTRFVPTRPTVLTIRGARG